MGKYVDKNTPRPPAAQAKTNYQRLVRMVQGNDYFKLFEITQNDSLEVINEKHQKMITKVKSGLYSDDPVAACEAEEKLRVYKDVYENVLKEERKKNVYVRLCSYRKEYEKVFNMIVSGEPLPSLQIVAHNITLLCGEMKEAGLPRPLLRELEQLNSLLPNAIRAVI